MIRSSDTTTSSLRQARPQRVQEPVGITRRQRREAPLDDPEVRDANLPRLATDRGVALEDHARPERDSQLPSRRDTTAMRAQRSLYLFQLSTSGGEEDRQASRPSSSTASPVLLDRRPPEHPRAHVADAAGAEQKQLSGPTLTPHPIGRPYVSPPHALNLCGNHRRFTLNVMAPRRAGLGRPRVTQIAATRSHASPHPIFQPHGVRAAVERQRT